MCYIAGITLQALFINKSAVYINILLTVNMRGPCILSPLFDQAVEYTTAILPRKWQFWTHTTNVVLKMFKFVTKCLFFFYFILHFYSSICYMLSFKLFLGIDNCDNGSALIINSQKNDKFYTILFSLNYESIFHFLQNTNFP